MHRKALIRNVVLTAILAASLTACGGNDSKAPGSNLVTATTLSSVHSSPTPVSVEPPASVTSSDIKTSSTTTSQVARTRPVDVKAITSALNSGVPIGFGAATTGGAGGEVVTVTTPEELRRALCSTFDGATCTDKTPRIVQVKSLIDFINTEGTTAGQGCTYSHNACTSKSGKQERILEWGNYCTGSAIFPINYDTAGTKPLAIGSNKTVIGIGNTAGIKGKGLYIGGGSSNVIIRNLSITDINEGIIWGGDAITIDGASKIWIDHNYFARIGRQMIVTGWGAATATTISNNFFDGQTEYGHYCNDKHYWVMLLIGDQQEITLLGNRFHRTSGRSPETGKRESGTGGIIHMVNNLYTENYFMGVSPTPDVNLLIEGTYFQPTGDYFFPIFTTNDMDLAYAPLDETLPLTDASCTAALGRACGPSYSQTEHSSFRLNSQVLSAVASNPTWRNAISTVVPLHHNEVSEYVTKNAGPQTNLK